MSTATAGQQGFTLRTDDFDWRHWAVVALAVITGVIHLWLGVGFVPEALGWAFLVAGVGFLAGVVALLVDYRRRLVYLLGVPFTLGQIVGWYVVNAPDFSPLGYADKVIQVVLIVLLVVLYREGS